MRRPQRVKILKQAYVPCSKGLSLPHRWSLRASASRPLSRTVYRQIQRFGIPQWPLPPRSARPPMTPTSSSVKPPARPALPILTQRSSTLKSRSRKKLQMTRSRLRRRGQDDNTSTSDSGLLFSAWSPPSFSVGGFHPPSSLLQDIDGTSLPPSILYLSLTRV